MVNGILGINTCPGITDRGKDTNPGSLVKKGKPVIS